MLQYDSGWNIEILSHTGQDINIRSILPNGNPNILTMHDGLFTLHNSNNSTTFIYEWQIPLPDITDLHPWRKLHFVADMVVEHAHRTYFMMDFKVLRQDQMTVGGCNYTVIVVERTDRRDGKVGATLGLWIAPSLRNWLRHETTQAGVTKVFSVTAMK